MRRTHRLCTPKGTNFRFQRSVHIHSPGEGESSCSPPPPRAAEDLVGICWRTLLKTTCGHERYIRTDYTRFMQVLTRARLEPRANCEDCKRCWVRIWSLRDEVDANRSRKLTSTRIFGTTLFYTRPAKRCCCRKTFQHRPDTLQRVHVPSWPRNSSSLSFPTPTITDEKEKKKNETAKQKKGTTYYMKSSSGRQGGRGRVLAHERVREDLPRERLVVPEHLHHLPHAHVELDVRQRGPPRQV